MDYLSRRVSQRLAWRLIYAGAQPGRAGLVTAMTARLAGALLLAFPPREVGPGRTFAVALADRLVMGSLRLRGWRPRRLWRPLARWLAGLAGLIYEAPG